MYGENGEAYRRKINGTVLISFEKLVHLLLYTDRMPYRIRKNRAGDEYSQPTKMAEHFNRLGSYARLQSPLFFYPPDFEFFFRFLREHPISAYSFVDWDPREEECENYARALGMEPVDGIDIQYARMANDFVDTFRKEAVKEQLKRKMADWHRGPKENKKMLAKILIRILQDHSRVVVIDLQFLYHQAACKGRLDAQARGQRLFERHISDYQAYMEYVDEMESVTVPDYVVGLDQLKVDLHKFFNNSRRNNLFSKDKFIDYVGRIEFGEEAGYHAHICFIFKGSAMKEQSVVHYSHEIGKYWKKITEGRGYYSSNNARAEAGKYPNHVGVGVVEYDDFDKLHHTWTTLSYFVKAAQVVRVKNTKREQMFLHGKPRHRNRAKLGRPRDSGISDEELRARLEKIFV